MRCVRIRKQSESVIQAMGHQSLTIEKLDGRIDAIELQMPQLIESRRLLMVGLGLIVSAFFIALIALAIK